MSKYKIVTDSTADLPQVILKDMNITVVPLKVMFGDAVYREGVDITSEEFFKKLVLQEKMPTTSQPSPVEFQEVYDDLTRDGSGVISIHISSRMSGTYQAAMLAKNALPDREIIVIDSQLVCMALGLVVLAAARAAKDGKPRDEIIEKIRYVMKNVHTYFVVDTLDYLQKGGRIGKASALIGTMLQIKPVLTIEDGQIAAFEKIRGKSKALDRIIEIAGEFTQTHERLRCAMVHGACLEELIKFNNRLSSQVQYIENIICEIGAVVGTHAGPGTMALFFYEDNETQA